MHAAGWSCRCRWASELQAWPGDQREAHAAQHMPRAAQQMQILDHKFAHANTIKSWCCTNFLKWCPGPDSNRHFRFQKTDFKSVASTNFATRADFRELEAGVGIEPAYTALQAAA